MPRVILTSCGTSLLTTNCWEGISKTESILRLDSPAKEEYEKRYRSYIQNYRNNPKGLAEKFVLDLWDDPSQITKLPAELASLRAIQLFCESSNPPGALNHQDRLILLHADNEEAIFCASVIHNVLTRDWNRRRLLNDVKIDPLWKIEELDASRPLEFSNSLLSLWNQLQEKFPQDPQIKYYLNLTGGYKAISILLSGFSFMRGSVDNHIFYLNEQSGKEVIMIGFYPGESNPKNRVKKGYIDSTGIYKGEILLSDL